jgi:predicted phosphohydrolase
MKIYAISDLHLSINCDKPMNVFGPVWDNYLDDIKADWAKKVKANDVVLIPGDISWAMKLEEALPDLKYVSEMGNGTKIMVRGNHDYWWNSIGKVRSMLSSDVVALQNDSVKIGKYVFCGSRGWTVPEYKHKTENDEKIYLREVHRLELSLKDAVRQMDKKDKLIVLMHYPPFNSKYEDSDFTKLFEKYGVKKVVFGHLHCYDKKQKLQLTKNKIKYYLTSCDIVGNKLIKI